MPSSDYDVKFEESIPDGKYSGIWQEFNITIKVDGKEYIGRCNSGVPKDYGYRFCVVTVANGKATAESAI